jgi:hypothetical protein
MSQEVETNANPEELGLRKSFKERHDGGVMENTTQSFFNFIPMRFVMEKKIYGKGIEQNQHANFCEDIDWQDYHS